MFKTSLIESGGNSPKGKTKLTFVVSLLLHAVVIVLLVIVPMWFVTALPQGELMTFLLSPPPPSPPPPPPPAPSSSGKPDTPAATKAVQVGFVAPERVPEKILTPSNEPQEDIDIRSGLLGGPAGISPGGVGNGGLGISSGVVLGHKVAVPPPPPPPPRIRSAPKRIGGDVLAARLIKKVEPIYPEIARRVHVEGMVMLQVTVNEMGLVEDLNVLRGHPLLTEAAVQAVQQWVYTPTLLNKEPVPVTATVIVNFTLRR